MVNNLIGTFNKKVEIYNLPQQHKLIISCLPMLQALSVKIARKTGYSSEDLFQESVLGLLKAIQLYKGENGAKFSTYGYFWALSFMSKYIDKENKVNKLNNYENEEELIQSPEKALLEKEKNEILKLSLLNLTPIQLKIIGLRFFTEENQNKSLNSLAKELCIKKNKINKIYKITLSELRQKCKDY